MTTTPTPPPEMPELRESDQTTYGMPIVIQALADMVRDHLERDTAMVQSPEQQPTY